MFTSTLTLTWLLIETLVRMVALLVMAVLPLMLLMLACNLVIDVG